MSSSHHVRTAVAVAICLAGVVSACSPADTPAGPSSDKAANVASGASIFEENCGICHGAGGRGPSLESLMALGPAELRQAIRNHPTAGTIPSRLPANEISDLVEFLDQ